VGHPPDTADRGGEFLGHQHCERQVLDIRLRSVLTGACHEQAVPGVCRPRIHKCGPGYCEWMGNRYDQR